MRANLPYLLCWAMVLCRFPAAGAEPSATDLLKNTKRSFESVRSYQWKLRVNVRTTSGTVVSERLCRQKDDSFESMDYESIPGSGGQIRTHFLWDMQEFYQYEEAVPLLMVSSNPYANPYPNMDFQAYFGGELDGCAGDGVPLHDILLNYPDRMHIANQSEIVSGVRCIRIEARNPFGNFILWVDPEAGYKCRKYEIHRGLGDLYSDFPLGKDRNSRLVKVDIFCDNIEIQKISAQNVAVSATLRRQMLLSDQTETSETATITRSEIMMNPDFGSLGAFNLNVKEDTEVYVADLGLRMIWKDGTYVHDMKPSQIDKVARDLAAVKADKPVPYHDERSPASAMASSGNNDQMQSHAQTMFAGLDSESAYRSIFAPLGILLTALGIAAGVFLARKEAL